MPTATIVTKEFVHEADVQKQALGMVDLVPAVITHPLSTLSEIEIEGRAQEAAEQIKQILTGSA
ncbi:MAG: hypothetical protein AAF485_08850 [Chloroflexota bacterium]